MNLALRIVRSSVSFTPEPSTVTNVIAEILSLLDQVQPQRRITVTHALETALSPVAAATD